MPCNFCDLPWNIAVETDRRLVRVGGCPVLSVSVSYPCLISVGEAAATAAVTSFNDTYRTAAERFTAWALDAPAAAATAAFESAGQGAAYRFARWEITCDMTPVWDAGGEFLRMETTAVWRVRRESDARKKAQWTDLWRIPSLYLEKPTKKVGRQRKT